MSQNDADTQGIHHLGLTVANVLEAAKFFVDILGFEQVGEKPLYPAIFVSDGNIMLTLWQVKDEAGQVAFNRQTNIGLHHFALKVKAGELDALHQRLAGAEGVEIEFTPEQLGDGPVRHMIFTAIDGIRIELIALPE